ncbi:MAG: Carboxypeptidase T [Firmicutes bacterium]|nr:Carboxypeptidase T [Bacillota bacterium]
MGNAAVTFDRYLRYQELTDALHAFNEKYPDFVTLASVGKSYEGRDIWAVTLTNSRSGLPAEKPGMYVDGNIHAGEVTGSMAALHLIDYLLSRYGADEMVTKLLDSRSFYILPRINPDGAELYLTSPAHLRSSVRPFPDFRKYEDPPGLHAEDFDGNGLILSMRIRDDARGAWKVDPEDARLMTERSPLDTAGPFYHIYTEGVLKDAKGEWVEEVLPPFAHVATKYGLDLNRNFPSGFSTQTTGAGPYPLSEPETRCQVEFISQRPNIAGVLLYHTTGGMLFRPHSTIPDKDFAEEDVALYTAIGKLGENATGYPVICCYGDSSSGVLDDWCFDQLGLLAFTPELWDAVGRAAPEMKADFLKSPEKIDRRKLELKLLQWNDRELTGEGFVPWHKVTHPQFGAVEVGGWKVKEYRQNPPRHLLHAECHRMTAFAIGYALALPEVHIDEVKVSPLGENLYSVHAVVSNHGFLSTNITKQAVKQKAVRPDLVRLELPKGMELLNCEHQYEVGHLEGYAAGQKAWFYYVFPPQKGTVRVKWNVRVKGELANPELTVHLLSQRGGSKRAVVLLGDGGLRHEGTDNSAVDTV